MGAVASGVALGVVSCGLAFAAIEVGAVAVGLVPTTVAVLAALAALGCLAVLVDAVVHRSFRFRAMPFRSKPKSVAAGALSLVAFAIVGLYLLAPGNSCGSSCDPSAGVQWTYHVTVCATFVMTAYFLSLYLLGMRATRRSLRRTMRTGPCFVMVMPARNEEEVIAESIQRLLSLRYDRFAVMVMNDDSDDATSLVAHRIAETDTRVIVIDRPSAVAGKGKGDVLNDAYRRVLEMAEQGDPRLWGATADEIVLGVVDADGWLEDDALAVVARITRIQRSPASRCRFGCSTIARASSPACRTSSSSPSLS